MNNPDVALDPGAHQTSSPETKVRIIETARKISKGWTRLETIEWIKQTYELSEQSAEKYWNAALSYLAVKATDAEYIAKMRERTVATLERLIQTEIEEGRYKEANTSMELMSKLLGYNIQKVEAKVDGDIRFDFGGE
jgi:hypothetical protein